MGMEKYAGQHRDNEGVRGGTIVKACNCLKGYLRIYNATITVCTSMYLSWRLTGIANQMIM